MPEHQEIEWKVPWWDGYLKWLCDYANAHGSRQIRKNDQMAERK